MSYFYVLRSKKDGKLYKGSSDSLIKRIADHNMGRVDATRHRRPLQLIYKEEFTTYNEALAREKYTKTLGGSKELKRIIDGL